MRLSGAEVLASTGLTFLASLIALSYLTGRAGVGIAPMATAIAALVAAGVTGRALSRQSRWRLADLLLYVAVVAGVLTYLVWLAWPAMLPLGSGPDLTHHLLLIDYLERRAHLVDVANAGPHLGEMAHYTPGLHLLAVIAGALTRSDGFHALYPIVALSMALKVGFFLLILLRLLREEIFRAPLAIVGVLLVIAMSPFSVSSFAHDSFLAQVVSELFAVAMWWTLVVWDQQPSRSMLGVFAMASVAAFLTWPVWTGPPVLTFVVLALMRRDLDMRATWAQGLVALAPLVVVAAVHVVGRSSWAAIVGTSGAVVQPSPAMLGWWLPALAIGGLVMVARDRHYRVVLVFSTAILAQAAILVVFAKSRGAATPYMAIKMTYLAIYPGIAAAVVAVAAALRVATRGNAIDPFVRTPRARQLAWAIVVLLTALVSRDAVAAKKPSPVVSHDLWTAGRWARDNVPPTCVDYLVGNEYAAYWLHLAVLGNSRASARTANNDTFLTEPSFARWVVPMGVRYAIADLRILPAEIRADVEVLKQFGSAAVIARSSGACPQPQVGSG